MSDTLHDKKCELVVLTAPSLVCKCKQRELERELAAAKAELAAAQAARDEARKFGEMAAQKYNDLLADQRILRCAFCDTEYPPDTPPTQHEALLAHVMVCQKHPMREVEAKLAKYEQAKMPEGPAVFTGAPTHAGLRVQGDFVTKHCYDILRTFAAAETVRADENEADAERYRFVRTQAWSNEVEAGSYHICLNIACHPDPNFADVDAAIDAALKDAP